MTRDEVFQKFIEGNTTYRSGAWGVVADLYSGKTLTLTLQYLNHGEAEMLYEIRDGVLRPYRLNVFTGSRKVDILAVQTVLCRMTQEWARSEKIDIEIRFF